MECRETCPHSKGERKTTRFKWVTNLKVKSNNIRILTNQGGRLRWKIENEGFNVQKNGGYALEHAYSRNPTAAKVFYYMLQIAHILAQLIEHGSLFCKAFPQGVGSAKNIAFCRIKVKTARQQSDTASVQSVTRCCNTVSRW
jgi:hypothetical protein